MTDQPTEPSTPTVDTDELRRVADLDERAGAPVAAALLAAADAIDQLRAPLPEIRCPLCSRPIDFAAALTRINGAIAHEVCPVPAAPAEPGATEVGRTGPPVDDLSTPESVLALIGDWVAGRRSWTNLGPDAPYTPDVIAAMDVAEVEKLRHLHAALAAAPAPADEGREGGGFTAQALLREAEENHTADPRQGHTCEVEAFGGHARCLACDRQPRCPECLHPWSTHAPESKGAVHRCLAPDGRINLYGNGIHVCRCLRSASPESLASEQRQVRPPAPPASAVPEERDEADLTANQAAEVLLDIWWTAEHNPLDITNTAPLARQIMTDLYGAGFVVALAARPAPVTAAPTEEEAP